MRATEKYNSQLGSGQAVRHHPLKVVFGGSNPSSPALRQAQCKLLFMWHTYILLCNQKTFYVGITNNVKKRLSDHRNKKSFFTKKFSDIKLVYSEEFKNKLDAAKREKQFKGWSRKKKIVLINKSLY